MRIQPKSFQADASIWSKGDPYTNPYVQLSRNQNIQAGATKPGSTGWFDPNPTCVQILPQHTPPGQPPQIVYDGYYIVKRHNSEYVEVYSPEEFAKRFNVVEPGAMVSKEAI